MVHKRRRLFTPSSLWRQLHGLYRVMQKRGSFNFHSLWCVHQSTGFRRNVESITVAPCLETIVRSPSIFCFCTTHLHLYTTVLHPRGIHCLVLSVFPHHCYSSEVDPRQNDSRVHTSNLTEFVSASLRLNVFVPWSWSLWIYVTLMAILILTN